MSTAPTPYPPAQRLAELLAKRSDLAVAALVVAIVVMMIVPLPTLAVDLLLAANLALATAILLTSLYLRDAAALASLPSVLLLTTLFRLGLNVSTTRLILLQADAGRVVQAFGEFVVAGNQVVGVVIFAILTVVQFVVIAKGAERVAEVAARFSLDAMPGQQLAIDADLRAGALTHEQAVLARAALSRRSRLYGALDGAMKFVKGDAIASVVIIAVNIVAGLIIGVAQRDMSLADAARQYTLLTVGDGLVSQIPALLIAMGAAMVVTRVDGERPGHLGADIGAQFGRHPRPLLIASAMLAALALVPGLPALPFLLLAALTAGLGLLAASRPADQDATAITPPDLLLSLGPDLLAHLGEDGGEALDLALAEVGERLTHDLGLPPLHPARDPAPSDAPWRLALTRDNLAIASLTANLRERVAVRAALDDLVNANLDPLDLTTGPSPLAWIPRADLPRATEAGLHHVPDHLALADLIADALTNRADQLLGLTATHALLAELERDHRPLVKALPLELPAITQLLRRLLRERVSIAPLPRILEIVAMASADARDLHSLTQAVRAGLAPGISEPFVGPDRRIHALLVDRAVEQMIRGGVRHSPQGDPVLELPLDIRRQLRSGARQAIHDDLPPGQRPIVLTDADVRPHLAALVLPDSPHAVILAFDELADDVHIEPRGRIRPGRQGA